MAAIRKRKLDDPSGNPIELFEPIRREASLFAVTELP